MQLLLESNLALLAQILRLQHGCQGARSTRCGQDWVGIAHAAIGSRYGVSNGTWHGADTG